METKPDQFLRTLCGFIPNLAEGLDLTCHQITTGSHNDGGCFIIEYGGREVFVITVERKVELIVESPA